MDKCSCYNEEERIYHNPTMFTSHTEIYSYCNGTRERDECSCGGDRAKCDFYPEVCEKALKEIAPKFGEWISVEDRLPGDDDLPMYCLVTAKVGDEIVVDWASRYYYKNSCGGEGATWEILHDWDEGQGCEITHWMPLPEPPKGE